MSQNIYMLLDHKRDFWALSVQTVAPKDLIVSLNYTQDIAVSVMLNKFFFHVSTCLSYTCYVFFRRCEDISNIISNK